MRLEAESGAVGFGEAAPIAWFGRGTVDDAWARLHALGERVDEETLSDLIDVGGVLGFALGAARAALREDRVEGAGAGRAYLPVAALLPAGRAALGAVDALAEAGFRTFKWKVGVLAPKEEWGLLDDVLARLPSGGGLRLDANGAWNRREAEQWLARAADRPIELIEQPVAADARAADDILRGLAEDYPTPVGLDESLATPGDLQKWIRLGWSGVWVVKPALLGDPATVTATLRSAQADVVFSSALETAVGMRAGLRMALDWTAGKRALGYGVGALFGASALNGLPAAAFVRREDLEHLNPEAAWTALN